MIDKKAFRPLFVAASVLIGLAVHASEARAQEEAPASVDEDSATEREASKQDAKPEEAEPSLEDRIKSVQRKVFLKKNRIEVFPYFGLDLNDPFRQHFLVGGSVGYHIVDSFGIEARGGVAIASVDQGAIRLVRITQGAVPLDPPEFQWHADLDATWAPFYGKISLLGEGILHFDTYLTAGPGVFGTDEGVNPAVNIGIGQRYYITRWLVARVELRDYIFIEERNGVSDAQNLLILGFSVSGFFPTSFEYEFQ